MRRNLQLLISEEFAEKTIPKNDSVRLADDMIDKLDLKCLFRTYSSNGRKYATNPGTLLKVLVYTNMQGIFSSRELVLLKRITNLDSFCLEEKSIGGNHPACNCVQHQ